MVLQKMWRSRLFWDLIIWYHCVKYGFPIIVNSSELLCLVILNLVKLSQPSLRIFWIILWSMSLSHLLPAMCIFILILLVTNHTETFVLLLSFDCILCAPFLWNTTMIYILDLSHTDKSYSCNVHTSNLSDLLCMLQFLCLTLSERVV